MYLDFLSLLILPQIEEAVSDKIDIKKSTECPSGKITPIFLKHNIKVTSKRNSNEIKIWSKNEGR